jgi:hypothetical protein
MMFKISEVINISIDENMDFLQFNWLYNRVCQKIKSESKPQNNLPGL